MNMSEEIQPIINSSLEDCERNDDLQECNRPKTESTLKYLIELTDKFKRDFVEIERRGEDEESFGIKFFTKSWQDLLKSHLEKIYEQILPSLMADIVFFYLTELPLNFETTSWYEFCSSLFWSEVFMTQFYKRLGNNSARLEYLIREHPLLLLNQWSCCVVRALSIHLPFQQLHEVLMTIKDVNGQTAMFFNRIIDWELVRHYQEHTDALYKLLSIQDVNKQTAVHVNTFYATTLLKASYVPSCQNAIAKLITIPDINNKTALDEQKGWIRDQLRWLIDQVEYERYVLYGKCNVLIIYNTGNRYGAKKEAFCLYDAFQSANQFNVKIYGDKKENEMIQLIEESVNQDCSGLQPSALIVVVVSHGSVGVIDYCNGKPVNLTSIEFAMCQKKLQNRPKILITQCCQVCDNVSQLYKQSQMYGVKPARGYEQLPFIPTHSDFCALMSCVPGECSKRGFFIGILAEHIRNWKPNEPIELVFQRVCTQMAADESPQTPIIQSTLKAAFCPMNHLDYNIPLPYENNDPPKSISTKGEIFLQEPVVFLQEPVEHQTSEIPMTNPPPLGSSNESATSVEGERPVLTNQTSAAVGEPITGEIFLQEPVVFLQQPVEHQTSEIPMTNPPPLANSSVSGGISNSEAGERSGLLNHFLGFGLGIIAEWPNVWPEPVEITEMDLLIDLKPDEDIKLRKALPQESEKIARMNREQHPPPTIRERDAELAETVKQPIHVLIERHQREVGRALEREAEAMKLKREQFLKKFRIDPIKRFRRIQAEVGKKQEHASVSGGISYWDAGEISQSLNRYACRKGDPKVIEKICSLILNSELLTLRSHRSTSDDTPRNGTWLHAAVSNGNVEAVRLILKLIENFPKEDQRELFDARNKDGSTIWQLELCPIMRLTLGSKFDSYNSPPLFHAKAEKYARVVHNEFPRNEQLFRRGAEVEADGVCRSLKSMGFYVKSSRDSSEDGILEAIGNDIALLNKARCSVYFVFIMTHGEEGQIMGADEKLFNIDNVLLKMKDLNTPIPKVLFIQACQGGRFPTEVEAVKPGKADAGLPSTQARLPQISIKDINTSVVVATLNHHEARRGLFMEFLSEEFYSIDEEEKRFDDIFHRVCNKMGNITQRELDPNNPESTNKIAQIPQMLTTLAKALMLRKTTIVNSSNER